MLADHMSTHPSGSMRDSAERLRDGSEPVWRTSTWCWNMANWQITTWRIQPVQILPRPQWPEKTSSVGSIESTSCSTTEIPWNHLNHQLDCPFHPKRLSLPTTLRTLFWNEQKHSPSLGKTTIATTMRKMLESHQMVIAFPSRSVGVLPSSIPQQRSCIRGQVG